MRERTANLPFDAEKMLSGEYRRHLEDSVKVREFVPATMADAIEILLGKQAIWATTEAPLRFHGFDQWANVLGSAVRSIADQRKHCIKLPLHGGVLDRDYLRSYIRFERWNNQIRMPRSGQMPTWLDDTEIADKEAEQHGRLAMMALAPQALHELMSVAPYGLHSYLDADPNHPRPQRGDLVFFNVFSMWRSRGAAGRGRNASGVHVLAVSIFGLRGIPSGHQRSAPRPCA